MLQFSSVPLIIRDEEDKDSGDRTYLLYAASTLGDFFTIDVRSGVVQKALRGHAAPINHFAEINLDKLNSSTED